MLTNDTHLLRHAPDLYVDAAALGTELVAGSDGAVAGTTFTSVSADFDAAGIDSGHVILIDSVPAEVDSQTLATELEVSRPRDQSADPKIPPTPGTGLAFSVLTFERQVSESQAWVLGAFGIDPLNPTTPLDETAIVNTDEVEGLIALRTIAALYELAATRDPNDAALAQQAVFWRDREQRRRAQAVVYLDLDGDGVPDATRRIDVATFTRR